ncbi:hypothetical protein OF83DRAFT_142742 [Amylostereum chailletii]|nr:hypothetical protein OF83DRAFT_142742 [Amylostereum chailletii]
MWNAKPRLAISGVGHGRETPSWLSDASSHRGILCALRLLPSRTMLPRCTNASKAVLPCEHHVRRTARSGDLGVQGTQPCQWAVAASKPPALRAMMTGTGGGFPVPCVFMTSGWIVDVRAFAMLVMSAYRMHRSAGSGALAKAGEVGLCDDRGCARSVRWRIEMEMEMEGGVMDVCMRLHFFARARLGAGVRDNVSVCRLSEPDVASIARNGDAPAHILTLTLYVPERTPPAGPAVAHSLVLFQRDPDA